MPDSKTLQKLITSSIKQFKIERKELKRERRALKKKTIMKYFSVRPNLGD